MKYSAFGDKFTGKVGIQELMEDLGKAIASGDKNQILLGGGNPSHIPEIQLKFRERMEKVLANGDEFERVIGNYDAPNGEKQFLIALADLLNEQFGWNITPKNLLLTNGSQSAFFFLFNLFAGKTTENTKRKILLPLVPEYIGYEDLGIEKDIFVTKKPEIEFLENRQFKYRVNFEDIEITDEIGAICVSRPSNPTGNVVSDEEVEKLGQLAEDNNIPLIIDGAYGTPFPSIIYTDAKPVWDEHIILCLSLSKLGLPGIRTGIVIANEKIIETLAVMNSVCSLAPGSMGVSLTYDMVKTGEIISLSNDVICNHYRNKMEKGLQKLQQELKGTNYYIHKPEGAMFFWLWLKDLPISSRELYERLKERGVICVSGHYFFPGIENDWGHKQECLRVTYAVNEEKVARGIEIIAEEVKTAYGLSVVQ